MKLASTSGYRGDMLRLAMEMRGYSARQLAKAAEIKIHALTKYLAGQEPDEETWSTLAWALDVPPKFFCRKGEIYQRDERYPLDFFVPLPKQTVSRETVANMLQNVPDSELEALAEYLNEIVEYGGNVTKLEASDAAK